jgi:hypothetical protein
MARSDPSERVLPGTLDLLILKTLSLAPLHGWGLTHRIQSSALVGGLRCP